ncbi:hypothetical protein FACS1894103_3440 [Campylobacterota bacterium]|nr:hypothetical protein FACS1894103_3440 [Campylobacterota bacterium]
MTFNESAVRTLGFIQIPTNPHMYAKSFQEKIEVKVDFANKKIIYPEDESTSA